MTEESAIQKDVQPNPRNAHLDDLAKRVQDEPEEILDESIPSVEDMEHGDEAPKETPEDPPIEEKETEVETLTIDGKKVEVEKSKVYETGKRALQKDLTADKRLEEATQLRNEAQTLLEDTKNQDAEQTEKVAAIADKLQFGEKEEGPGAVQELIDLTQGQQPDPKQIADEVTQRVNDQQEFKAAMQYVDEEYSDVLSNDLFKREFRRRDQEARDDGDERTYKELYTAIAEDMRTEYKDLLPTQDPGGLKDRAERAKASKTPSSATAPAAKTQEEKPKSTVEIIAEMRKSRGQS